MKLRLQITIDAHGDNQAWGNITVTEDANIDVSSFMEIAEIIGKFHALAQQVAKVE